MASTSVDLDVSPNPRTREENQERAFIAASRRKDRSLDARLESANRASLLHKQRTGKALLISREIVEKEAMYEEVDDRYKEKLNRMIQMQTMSMKDDFPHSLLTSLPFRPGGLQQRRASSMTPRASMDGIRKMSLDLSGLRASVTDGMHGSPMASPMGMGPSYVMSPTFDASSQSPSYPNVVPASSGPLPSYLAPGQAPASTWASQTIGPQAARGSWAGFPMPMGDLTMSAPPRQFRDRMGSAPVIPVQAVPSASGARTASQHSRNRSEPGQPQTLGRTPHVDMLPTEPLPTPELCPTPSTPHSPTSGAKQADFLNWEGLDKDAEGLGFSHGLSDEDFDNFNQYALSLNSNSGLADDFKIDELVAFDDFPVSA
ncbi:predicted protein [Aspergillus terreus NIH2624]|uniref:Uncharacterized protein n=1 Tax=Aspergillus terreus (strain NIH 2624 / FGSC A1156) TaxID=341663 RepID=Q0CTN0_ASPTN|nr:uncharacterized protein ATEG_02954 [Aspergillus terreus NIH2624]EAU36228.1 predicted protein [Aspergillus terreus NIH2624]